MRTECRWFSLHLVFGLQLFGSLSGVKDGVLANMDWCKGIVRRTMSMAPPRLGDPFGLPFRAYLIWRVGLGRGVPSKREQLPRPGLCRWMSTRPRDVSAPFCFVCRV